MYDPSIGAVKDLVVTLRAEIVTIMHKNTSNTYIYFLYILEVLKYLYTLELELPTVHTCLSISTYLLYSGIIHVYCTVCTSTLYHTAEVVYEGSASSF